MQSSQTQIQALVLWRIVIDKKLLLLITFSSYAANERKRKWGRRVSRRDRKKNANTNSTKIIAAAFPEAGRLAPIRGSVLCCIFYQTDRLKSGFETRKLRSNGGDASRVGAFFSSLGVNTSPTFRPDRRSRRARGGAGRPGCRHGQRAW